MPRRRASQPSIWSVAIATTNTAVAQYAWFGKSQANRTHDQGTAATRATVS